MKQQTKHRQRSKTIDTIKPLRGIELERFRTRGIRRKERSVLSGIWPKVWSPTPQEYRKLLETDEQYEAPLTNGRWMISQEGDERSRFELSLEKGSLKIVDKPSGALLLALPSDGPWITATPLLSSLKEDRGFFHLSPQHSGSRIKGTARECHYYSGRPSTHHMERDELIFEGAMLGTDLSSACLSSLKWQLCIKSEDSSFEMRNCCVTVSVFDHKSHHTDTSHMPLSVAIHLLASPHESIFGMGSQLTWLNLKGKVVPSWAQEPGIGRGVQPLTWFMESAFGAGGSDVQSSAPSPVYMTSQRQTHLLDDHRFALFDFTRDSLRSIEVWGERFSLRVLGGEDTPRGRLHSLSKFVGVMPPLPAWIDRGAIIGLQGGSSKVEQRLEILKKAEVPISALWLQDWVGQRKTSIGEQLWWDWSLDLEHYPRWYDLLRSLEQSGISVLGYINPYLVDTGAREGRESIKQQSLFKIAKEKGYLVKDPSDPNVPLMIKNTSFEAAIVDLSDSEAFDWLKDMIKERMVNAGIIGWMADFGEALPPEVELKQGTGLEWHNRFPEEWARLNRELIDSLDEGTQRYLFFNRSGYLRTPRHSQLTWLGDQLTSWKKYDGIYSGLVGLLSSGFSGVSLSHSDTGGYICTDPPRTRLRVPFMSHARSPELLMRWTEMNAFTAILRTHEGNQPDRHHQIYDDAESLRHFSKMSQLFVALAPVRRTQMERLAEGFPLVAHPWLYFPNDPHCLELEEQFMLSEDIMVAPVIRRGWQAVKLYLPEGAWGHWWSHERHVGPCWLVVPAPLGAPAAFYREGSVASEIAKAMSAEKVNAKTSS